VAGYLGQKGKEIKTLLGKKPKHSISKLLKIQYQIIWSVY